MPVDVGHADDRNNDQHHSNEEHDNDNDRKDSQREKDNNEGDNVASLYDDVIQNGDGMTSIASQFLGVEKSSVPKAQAQMGHRQPAPVVENQDDIHLENDDVSRPFTVSTINIVHSRTLS